MSRSCVAAMRQLLLLLPLQSIVSTLGGSLPSTKMSTFDAPIVDILWLGADRRKVLLNTQKGTELLKHHDDIDSNIGDGSLSRKLDTTTP